MRMEHRIKFGKWEAGALMINIICTKIFLYFNRMTVEDAGTAGWLMTLFTCAVVLLAFSLLIWMYKKFEGNDILDIAEMAGGKVFSMFTGFILGGVLLLMAAITLRQFSEDIKTISLPTSPLSYVMFFFMAGMVVAGFLGLESIVRNHAVITPIAAAGYVIILLGITPKIDINNIMPIFGTGLKDIAWKGLYRTSIFSELLVLSMIPPFLENYRELRIVGFSSLGFSSFILVTSSLAYILVFPYPSSLEPFLPVFNMTRLIGLGRFFQRIESLFVFIWVMSALAYLSAVFYFAVYTVSKAAGLKYLRPMIIPFAVIVFCIAFIPSNLISAINIQTDIINTWGWTATFAFIGLIMLWAGVMKRGRRGAKGK
jgi:spore germination protein (amino acid permease)